MIKKMVSHGNSAALIIDKPILEILKIDMDTPLEVSTDGKNLIISPVQDAKREGEFIDQEGRARMYGQNDDNESMLSNGKTP